MRATFWLQKEADKEAAITVRSNEILGYVYDAAGNLNTRTNNALIQTFAANNLNELRRPVSLD